MRPLQPATTIRETREPRTVRILVVGASGLIGSAVAAHLGAQGHQIVMAIRSGSAAGLLPATIIRMDLARATSPQDWLPHLVGIDAVVNCAGTLQDSPGESTAAVHVDGVSALFHACERARVRRVVHLSAVRVDREAPTKFSQTKLAGDRALMERDLDWVILRPSVVVGRAAYGGSALFRGLAALPVMPVAPRTGALQLVHLDDVVRAVAWFLEPGAPSRQAVDLVGPRRWTFEEVVRLFRAWLRWQPAPVLRLPAWVANVMYRLGDLVSLLGWRPPMRSTARREIVRGATGDAGKLTRLTGMTPIDIENALAAEPASVQERWFARLYFIKPLVFGVFALFWITTGLISLGPGWEIGMGLMREGGVGETMGTLTVIAGALADIVIGLAIAYRPTARYGLYAALTISITYAIIGTWLVPRLWIDPLGPMLKIWPIMVFNLVALAIHEDR
jgi:uncharacterized protein YbjT (DUF2867 family)